MTTTLALHGRLCAVAVAATAALFAPCLPAAESYPNRPVRLIVPYPPGGATDMVARALGIKMGAALGQQFVVDNRGGGGQLIGTDLAAKAAANGYTFLLVSVTHSINPSLRDKMPYDTIKDFAPIVLIAQSANILVTHPSVPARSVKQLIALLKAQPGKLNYASSGTGSGGHLAAELFKSMARVNMVHVPYKGGGPAYIDLVAGHVDLMFTSPAPTLPHVKAGRLRALATTGAGRSLAMPNLPTIAESGFPGYEATLWYGFVAPAGTPEAIIRILNREAVKALADAAIRESFVARGIEPAGGSPEQFAAHIRSEMRKWEKVIRNASIRLQ
jgi:tripartite-type tricarboxylate transporter receptor subunit TctC